MSLTTDIANLNTRVMQLIQTVDEHDDIVRAKIAQLAAMAPDTQRTIYVDASGGDDTNDGRSPASPVATLDKALSCGVPGGVTVVRLLSDVGHDVRSGMPAGYVHIEGWDAASDSRVMRTISYASRASNRTDYIAGFSGPPAGLLWFNSVTHDLPNKAAGVPDVNANIILMWRGGTVVLHTCDINGAAGDVSYLLRSPHAVTSVSMFNTSIAPSLAAGTGRLFYGVAANADPNTPWNIVTNITAN